MSIRIFALPGFRGAGLSGGEFQEADHGAGGVNTVDGGEDLPSGVEGGIDVTEGYVCFGLAGLS
ncbi:hypothetical protein [Streptomyces jumonjinensis]|uniref:Uncharacterized protein n=1 Tax=Streptomyces jumonjinensis TaxID=1945 RepID=A0A646KPS7_STRJU|nr:hypothetical protein [Streptomyces jumonjinensis]MQT04100.1 hypothetical protein [Streptomyces jumonjinensis]